MRTSSKQNLTNKYLIGALIISYYLDKKFCRAELHIVEATALRYCKRQKC